MRSLPIELRTEYRLATIHEIRSWSFGELQSARRTGVARWDQQRGTILDEGIFGPTREFECACGKYRGKQYEKMICDICGVKITSPECRRKRFAHVELSVAPQHPFGGPSDKLHAFPVIPAVFIESVAGHCLADTYDSLVSASAEKRESEIGSAIDQIVGLLLPIAVEAQRWNLPDAVTFARGIGLEHVDAFGFTDELCEVCGYPIAGLTATTCPGCGRRLRN